MFKRATRLAAIVVAIAAAGCSGSDGAQGPQGVQGPAGQNGTNGNNGTNGTDYTAALKNEACGGCHDGTGSEHSDRYKKAMDATAYTLAIDSVQTVGTTSAMTISITTNGAAPYTGDPNLAWIDQKTFYATFYNPASRQFLGSFSYSGPSSTGVDGQFVVTASSNSVWAPEAAGSAAFAYSYIAKDQIGVESPYTIYNDVVNVGRVFNGPIAYESVANVSACERCHGAPYRKHGYRMAQVAGLPDFVACKTCHYDNRKGGHEAWSLLADNPLAYANQAGTPTTAQKTLYAYTANVMNDVHMSHAMEFEFPQSMANCVTCHDGKLTGTFGTGTPGVLNNVNFKLSTCKSCHPVKGPESRGAAQKSYIQGGRAPALEPMMASTIVKAPWASSPASNHTALLAINGTTGESSLYTSTASCTGCHNGTDAPTFAQLHSGYDSRIYTSANDGTKYSDVFTATIDSASLTTQTLTVSFSVTKTGVDPLNAGSVTPTVLIGLYGFDSKDFLVDPHGRDAGAGLDPASTTGGFNRTLEWVYGKSHNRFKKLTAGTDGKFKFTVDLGTWTSQLATTSLLKNDIRRLEIAVLPTLKDAAGAVVAITPATKTFDLIRKVFDPFTFATKIVSNAKCNACHDALAVTFHSPDRGDVTTCRFCHNTKSGGGHLEMQSRSIDSYVHAIHAFQAFDIGGVDFADTVAKTWYNLKTESTFPVFTTMACEACHNAGTYNSPPWQGSSMPGLHSASATLTNATRNINGVPSYVMGPGARACGSCHRAQYIKEDNAGALGIMNEHVKANGYLLPETGGVLADTITKIMSIFK
jgi:OmcA/MtrC family decaheme c-type cytochrome